MPDLPEMSVRAIGNAGNRARKAPPFQNRLHPGVRFFTSLQTIRPLLSSK
jgi:hypothetical protein